MPDQQPRRGRDTQSTNAISTTTLTAEHSLHARDDDAHVANHEPADHPIEPPDETADKPDVALHRLCRFVSGPAAERPLRDLGKADKHRVHSV